MEIQILKQITEKTILRNQNKSGKQGFVLFYGRFCPYCRKYAPVYEQLQKWVDSASINEKRDI